MPKTSLSGQFLFTMKFDDEEEIDDMIDWLQKAKKSKYPVLYVTLRDVREPEKETGT